MNKYLKYVILFGILLVLIWFLTNSIHAVLGVLLGAIVILSFKRDLKIEQWVYSTTDEGVRRKNVLNGKEELIRYGDIIGITLKEGDPFAMGARASMGRHTIYIRYGSKSAEVRFPKYARGEFLDFAKRIEEKIGKNKTMSVEDEKKELGEIKEMMKTKSREEVIEELRRRAREKSG